MRGQTVYDLGDRLIDFSVMVTDVVGALPANRIGNHIAGQLLRAGTAAAPNHAEAQSAESNRDFVHKLKLGLKELRETVVWLKIIRKKNLLGSKELLESTLAESDELIAIFVTSIRTASGRRQSGHGNIQHPTFSNER